MLNLYVNTNRKDVQFYNDAFFLVNLDKIVFDETVIRLMYLIDGVSYAGNHRFYSKFDNLSLVRIENLSTGCKTAINIYSFPDNIFYLGECGVNALTVIANLSRGNTFTNEFINTELFTNQVRVICKKRGIDRIVSNDKELRSLLFDIT